MLVTAVKVNRAASTPRLLTGAVNAIIGLVLTAWPWNPALSPSL